MTVMEVVPADTPELLLDVRALLKEYASLLGNDLSLNDLAHEIASLPGIYAAPEGALLVARVRGRAAGCVGVRRLEPGVCEMKRHFVRHSFRGRGVGRRLALASVDQARALGYRAMRLATLPWMREAVGLYASMGFVEIPPYRPSPVAGAVFMERDLA